MNRPRSDPYGCLRPQWWTPGLAPYEREPGEAPLGVPVWAAWIERVIEDWPVGSQGNGIDSGGEPAFAEIALPLAPLVGAARTQVERELGSGTGLELAGIGRGFAEQLTGRLAELAARTLVTELNGARNRGELNGSTSRLRFVDFVRQLSDGDEIGALFSRYPVLARLVGLACVHAVEYQVELLGRFAADRTAIVGKLLHGVDPGALVSVTMNAGDPHQRGRAVALLYFEDGSRIVYKPRCQQVDELFGEVVAWFNTTVRDRYRQRGAAALSRPDYGWVEFIEYRACADATEVDRFYRRLGAALALLYTMEATDIHYENLIACADEPVLVDVETLFHPHLAPAMLADPDPAMVALDSSVYRISLLPHFQIGDHGVLDLSGMGGDPGKTFPADRITWESVGTDRMRLVRAPVGMGAAQNRPTLNGQEVEPAEYLSSLLDGFRTGYGAILSHRDELLGLLPRFTTCVTRLVARPTQLYATLLGESTHPDLLRDAADRDRVFDLLRQDPAGGPIRQALTRHELDDLWAGDVPLFTTRPGSRDIWTSTGQRLPDLLDEAGLPAAAGKVAALSELDRQQQEWLVSAALGVRVEATVPHHSGPLTGSSPVAAPPDPQRLLVEACGIADEIVAMAVHDRGRANWIGMELVDGRYWAVQPLGAALGNGYTGVALFLAQLGALTGAARYAELARKAVQPLPNLIEAMTAAPDVARVIGPGGYHGLAGIGYALSRLACLDGDTSLNDCVTAIVELVAGCAEDCQAADLTFGLAGGLAAMQAVHEETGIPSAGRVARDFADRLLELPELDGAGIAMGPPGVAFALARFACGADRHLAKARSIPLHGDDPTNYAWCTGLSGLLVARAALAGPGLDDLDRSVALLAAQRSPIRDMSLCHGELGVLDALRLLDQKGHRGAMELLPVRAARLHAFLVKNGPRCGTPNGVPSPGFMTGLSGIGYGLLRIGFPTSVPSILAFESGRRYFSDSKTDPDPE